MPGNLLDLNDSAQQLLDLVPRRLRTRDLQWPGTQGSLLDLRPSSPQMTPPEAPPQVQAPDDHYAAELSQARDDSHQARDQFDQAMGNFNNLLDARPNVHRSLAGRIGEAAVSLFSPSAAHAIWESPVENRWRAYNADVSGQTHKLSALHQAYQDSLADLRNVQQGHKADAYYDWMMRRGNEPDYHTQNLLGPDNKTHSYLLDFHRPDQRQDLGVVPERRDTNLTDTELFVQDPDAYARMLALRAKYPNHASGATGTFYQETDDAGNLIDYYNPTTGARRKVTTPGLRRSGGVNPIRQEQFDKQTYLKAQKQALANLKDNADFVFPDSEDKAQQLLEAETQRILRALPGSSAGTTVKARPKPGDLARKGNQWFKATESGWVPVQNPASSGETTRSRQ